MSVNVRVNNSDGLLHAVSLSNIESSFCSGKSQYTMGDRNYDSDEGRPVVRRRLRYTQSSELYTRPSHYSKRDIQEQYCLTDRQTITMNERTRRGERLFGCLSRHTAPSQSFLGGCVGRRIPSDENIATSYAPPPFYRGPRFPHQYTTERYESLTDLHRTEPTYLRRQPASILSTPPAKTLAASHDPRSYQRNIPSGYQANPRRYAEKTFNYLYAPQLANTTTSLPGARSKHVSFARSHTLTSFDDFNADFQTLSAANNRVTDSQERLIGSKKVPDGPLSVFYDSILAYNNNALSSSTPSALTMIAQQPILNHTTTINYRQPLNSKPYYPQVSPQKLCIDIPVDISSTLLPTKLPNVEELSAQHFTLTSEETTTIPEDNAIVRHQGSTKNLSIPSPEVIVVERRFRNAMKTQATQTEARRQVFEQSLALSPRTIHRVRVVSQGAQTNGSQSLAEWGANYNNMNNDEDDDGDNRSAFGSYADLAYYEPPPPPLEYDSAVFPSSLTPQEHHNCRSSTGLPYQSNSLPKHFNNWRIDDDPNSLPPPTPLPPPLPLPQRDLQPTNPEISINDKELRKTGTCDDLISVLVPPPREYSSRDDSSMRHFPTNHKYLTPVPFQRNDVKRQSMPLYMKSNRNRFQDENGSLRRPLKQQKQQHSNDDVSSEKEIIIDFKPVQLEKKKFRKVRHQYNLHDEDHKSNHTHTNKVMKSAIHENQGNDSVYQNIQSRAAKPLEHGEKVAEAEQAIIDRSISTSPIRELASDYVSAYQSSDSLTNDGTKDQSESHWNESDVTVLLVDQRTENLFAANPLLTPSTRRKKLLLQHQQRSSIDTDALDMEEQMAEASAALLSDSKPTISVEDVRIPESISAFAKDCNLELQRTISLPKASSDSLNEPPIVVSEKRNSEDPLCHYTTETSMVYADLSECSTNTNNTNTHTEEYATCTDTTRALHSQRVNLTVTTSTQKTMTSSSSATQNPVSTHSSQIDRTYGESSFESASSLQSSSKGDQGADESLQQSDINCTLKNSEEPLLKKVSTELPQKSLSYSFSSISTIAGEEIPAENWTENEAIFEKEEGLISVPVDEPDKREEEHYSDDDMHSELHYSSSGYYESPQDDADHKTKCRRFRSEDERNRRKASMKLEFDTVAGSGNNNNNHTSNVSTRKDISMHSTDNRKGSPYFTINSPLHIKRHRSKTRRQLRRPFKSEDFPGKFQNAATEFMSHQQAQIDPDFIKPDEEEDDEENSLSDNKKQKEHSGIKEKENTKPVQNLSPKLYLKSSTETISQLKTKSSESLNRSVSPGSDSVFYSEADNVNHPALPIEKDNLALSNNLRNYKSCYKNSAESLTVMENEQEDIVKPPSDFADSPIANKISQRLYKKVEKRIRSEDRYHGDRGRHFKIKKDTIRAKSEERTQELRSKTVCKLRATGSSPSILPVTSTKDSSQTIYMGHYDAARYTRLNDVDLWTQLSHQKLDHHRNRHNSTESEKSFCSKYQVILHRLVQRRCTLEMYQRQKNNNFCVDKTIIVKSDSGEFGFRIHGSKPVVVAAIEPDTPAENSGLEVGDIIISVNGVQVLDKHHTEVVKIAHDGCEKLELEVARTLGVLLNEQKEPPLQIVYSGYLWRQSGQAKGFANPKKWVKRWFVLRSDNCLYYYKTEEDTQPVGAMIMARHTIEGCSLKSGRSNAFKIDDAGESIPTFLSADTNKEADHWINILRKASVQNNLWLDKNARNLYKPPNSIDQPDCFGYLMKQGSKWYGWSKQYCVLKDACLYFFHDANSQSALGMVCLHGYKVATLQSTVAGKRNSFEIIPPDAKLRHYYFYTDSDMEKKRWISALEYSIDRWIKSG